jgi:hypothetical protein
MTEARQYTQEELTNRFFGFPEGLTYIAYTQLPTILREHIVTTNRIVQTDTYNRTMEHIYGEEWDTPATYTPTVSTLATWVYGRSGYAQSC